MSTTIITGCILMLCFYNIDEYLHLCQVGTEGEDGCYTLDDVTHIFGRRKVFIEGSTSNVCS